MTTYIKIGATSYNAADYTLPAERTFRDGWEANDDGTITVNMTKAKDATGVTKYAQRVNPN